MIEWRILYVKTLFVGDIHNKAKTILPQVDEIIKKHNVDKTVLMGDYINDFDTTARQEIDSALFLVDWTLSKPSGTVVPLIGNHDVPYLIPPYDSQRWPIIENGNAPGFRKKAYRKVHEAWTSPAMKHRWRAAYAFTTGDGRRWLCSHAGFTEPWCTSMKIYDDADHVDIYKIADTMDWLLEHGRWSILYEDGWGRGGSGWGSLIWADKREVLDSPLPGTCQIAGHSIVSTVESYYTGSDHELTFVDTMSSWYDENGSKHHGDGSLLLMDSDTGEWSTVNVICSCVNSSYCV